MLYICIPTFNEAPTIGVLLWQIRKVFQEHSREYEVLIYDDASTDATTETLAPYADVLPLTVLRGEVQRGYGHALNALCREVTRRSRYPRRDAMVVMQADFTDRPASLPDLIKRFEGGADIVIGERNERDLPKAVRRLRSYAPWAIKWHVRFKDITDPFSSFRLYRVTLIKEALKNAGDTPVVTTDGWAANIELLAKVRPHARRIESVPTTPRYDIRPRDTRIRPFADAMSLYKFTKRSRGWHPPARAGKR